MQFFKWSLWVSLFMASVLSAQSTVDVATPPGFPVLDGPIFANATSVTGVTYGVIPTLHTLSGLPGNPSYSVMPTLGGSLIRKLSDEVAVIGTFGGTTSIVTGLPANPQILTSNVPWTSVSWTGSDVVLVNPTTAILPVAQGFQVMRFVGSSIASTLITSPEALVLQPRFLAGVASPDTAYAMGVGADGLAGTLDDTLVRIDGLNAPNLAGITVAVEALSLAFVPTELSVMRSGAAMLWRQNAGSMVQGLVIQINPSNLTTLPLNIPLPSVNQSPSGLGPIIGVVVGQDGIHFSQTDSQGQSHALFTGLSGIPRASRVWAENQFGASDISQVLTDRLIHYPDFISQTGFGFTRYQSALNGSFYASDPVYWLNYEIVLPNERSIAVFSRDPFLGSGELTLITDSASTSFPMPGVAWTEEPINGRKLVFAMGKGRVGGFLSYLGTAAPGGLRMCSFPVSSPQEASGKRFGSVVTTLSLSNALPSITQPLTIQVSAPGSTGLLWLGVANALQSAIPLPPGDALIHLDIMNLAALLPLNPTPAGSASFTVAAPNAPSLIGAPIYLQAVAAVAGATEASDLAMVIYGP